MNTEKYGLKEFEKEHGPLTFGEALQSYRLGEEISQVQMAERIGISQQSLCDIESGRRIPSPKRVVKIARIIGEPEQFWIKLALQDGLRKDGLDFKVSLTPAGYSELRAAYLQKSHSADCSNSSSPVFNLKQFYSVEFFFIVCHQH